MFGHRKDVERRLDNLHKKINDLIEKIDMLELATKKTFYDPVVPRSYILGDYGKINVPTKDLIMDLAKAVGYEFNYQKGTKGAVKCEKIKPVRRSAK